MLGPTPEGVWPSPRRRLGASPSAAARPGCSACPFALTRRGPKPPFGSARWHRCGRLPARSSAEAAFRTGARVTGDGAHANSSRRASPHPGPKPWIRCFLAAARPAEAGVAAAKLPFGWARPRSRLPAGALPGFGVAHRLAEAGWLARRSPESRLPPALHRGVARVQDTQRGIWTTPPLGFGPLRRFGPGDRCVGLPHRHHPLSGFLTLSAV